mmetsp:Transcript_39488/g.53635  ORF Transcript_39488/g.53635 Transcript_39488/m.53635 type:complete len:210 (-) Transcript_39488:1144-1773(-)
MNPMLRPSTKSPLRHPFAMRSSASSSVKAPQLRSRSTKHTAMHPSTFRMRLPRFRVVICSTPSANSRILLLGKCFMANSLMMTTRMSGLSSDFIRWPIPMMSLFSFRIFFVKLNGSSPLSTAAVIILAASSRAPPNRGPMVRRPEQRAETRSFPALEATMVLCAPLTAGPWSAVTMRTISINLHAYGGSLRRNHRRDNTPPTPSSSSKI